MRLAARGLSVDVPDGWETRLRAQAPSVAWRPGNTLLHACTRPLPAERGDFGTGVVDLLGPDDVFVSLFEYDPEHAGTALFEAQGLPVVRPSEFSPNATQRPLPGQSGGQWFFTAAGRAFCLFVVLGSHSRRAAGAVRVTALLSRLRVEAS
jgi:hypothetical protein